MSGHGFACRDEIAYVGREGLGELPAALAKAGEVEAQDPDPRQGEGPGEAGGREAFLPAGEAVGEDRPATRGGLRLLDAAGELVAARAQEVEGGTGHDGLNVTGARGG